MIGSRSRRWLFGTCAFTAAVIAVPVWSMRPGDHVDLAVVDDVPTTTVTSTTTASAAQAPLPPPGDPALVPVVGGAGGRLVPWGEGFLHFGKAVDSPELPAFDDAVLDTFPPEIVEAVQAAGATNVQEAMEALAAVGLLNQAAQIVMDNPDLYDAVFGAPAPAFRFAQTSLDGLTWTTVDGFEHPGDPDFVDEVASDGEHLVIAYHDRDGPGLHVASTTNLVDWTVVDIPHDAPIDPPGYIDAEVGFGSLSVGPDGWYVLTRQWGSVDLQGLVPAAVASRDQIVSIEPTPEALVVHHADGNTETSTSVAWDELEADYDTVVGWGAGGGGPVAGAWTGSWTGTLTEASAPAGERCCAVVGTDSGFLAQRWGDAGDLYFSVDGHAWERRLKPVDASVIDGMVGVDGGVVVRVFDTAGSHLWHGTPDGTGWQPVDIPDPLADANIYLASGGSRGVASVVELDSPPVITPGGITVVPMEVTLERNGVRFFTEVLPDGTTLTVITDLETGVVLLDETRPPEAYGTLPSYVAPTTIGFAYLDSDGEELVEVSLEEVVPPPGPQGVSSWLVASHDGIEWLFVELPPRTGLLNYSQASINGTTVVAAHAGQWLSFST